jgi:N-acetylglucosaminyldiphosphoundecaprenol N-acetyl-beta-D-mannosaminyltransferase
MRQDLLQERRRAGDTTDHRQSPGFPRLCVDNVRFDNVDRETALGAVRMFLAEQNGAAPRVVNFVNVHSIHLARGDRRLNAALQESDLVLPDGSGLALAGRVAGKPIRENLNGTDFIPLVLGEAERSDKTVYLLGARKEILRTCERKIAELYPALRIVGSRHGHFSAGEEEGIVADIREARPDILLVGMGTPAQELWISRHARSVGARVCFGVGGLFDFLSGMTPRAPRWVRRVGLEWVYRFVHNPASKWDRVLVEIPLFVLRTVAGRVPVSDA